MGLGLDEAEGDLSNLRKNTNLEAIPKPRLRPNICVTRRLNMLTYPVACWAFSLPRAVILNLI